MGRWRGEEVREERRWEGKGSIKNSKYEMEMVQSMT